MTFDELRDEFDWMFEFQSRMAERIRDDADVHNLVDYVTKLETENAKLRELLLDVWNDATEFDGFWDYVHDDGEIYNVDELPHYQERMRELGIEAN